MTHNAPRSPAVRSVPATTAGTIPALHPTTAGPPAAAVRSIRLPIPLPCVTDEGASASRWLFRAADEALLAFVQQAQPRMRGLSDFAAHMLKQLSSCQRDWVRSNLEQATYRLDEWNSIQPACLLAFEHALIEPQSARSISAPAQVMEDSTQSTGPAAGTAESAIQATEPTGPTSEPAAVPSLHAADRKSSSDADQDADARQTWYRVLADCQLIKPDEANAPTNLDAPQTMPALLDDAAVAELEQFRDIKRRGQRKRHMDACLKSEALGPFIKSLQDADPRTLERRLNTLIRDGACAQTCGVLLGLLQRVHTAEKVNPPKQVDAKTDHVAVASGQSPSFEAIDGPAMQSAPELMEASEIVSHFLARLPDTGNDQHRKRTVYKAMLLTDTTQLGILVSRANLHTRKFNPMDVGARKRSLMLVPEMFYRMTDPLGDLTQLVAMDLLQTTSVKPPEQEDARAFHFRLTLLCGLYGRLHLLHAHRRTHRMQSNWHQFGQGLLHFNFLHTVTGLDALPELTGLLQTAFCECMLDAGRMIPADAMLMSVWNCTDKMRERTQLRARMLARDPAFLGTALRSREQFSALISSLTVSMVHARMILSDPLRRHLAASLLKPFVETLLTELAPFNTFKTNGNAAADGLK